MKWILLGTILAVLPVTEKEWRQKLGDARYQVMRQKQTERAFLGKAILRNRSGTYSCAACEATLFRGEDQYDVGNGWPNFKQPVEKKAVYYLEDRRLSFKRYEVLCRTCDSHLGHVFNDGPPPKNLRYCINSLALHLQK